MTGRHTESAGAHPTASAGHTVRKEATDRTARKGAAKGDSLQREGRSAGATAHQKADVSVLRAGATTRKAGATTRKAEATVPVREEASRGEVTAQEKGGATVLPTGSRVSRRGTTGAVSVRTGGPEESLASVRAGARVSERRRIRTALTRRIRE